ncbi:hypothetical protein NIES2111_18220 [Nostoc sp. NIES-2111]|nr:hypothetical protein NIES2111_18220 [Nostoc sp. NIES-2111]
MKKLTFLIEKVGFFQKIFQLFSLYLSIFAGFNTPVRGNNYLANCDVVIKALTEKICNMRYTIAFIFALVSLSWVGLCLVFENEF